MNRKSLITKGIITIVIILFVGMNVIPSTAIKQSIENPFPLDFDGNTLYVGGSGPNNYTSIQEAIDNSSDGDTVFVYNGTYYENNIDISKSINLIGEDKNITIIKWSSYARLIWVRADNVNIGNFTINTLSDAIIVENNENICISDCIFISLGRYIYFGAGNNIIIKGNVFSSQVEGGMYMSFSKNFNISENIFTNSNSITEYPRPDVELWHSNNITIYKNHFIGGDYQKSQSIFLSESSHNVIKSNIIESYSDDGIYVSSSSEYNAISYNSISNCDDGIVITGQSSFNDIINNNFENNGDSASFSGFSYNNEWDGNYWDRSRIFPYPVIGRIFFIIPWINFDWHPAQEPYDI